MEVGVGEFSSLSVTCLGPVMLLNEGLTAFGPQGQVQGWHLEVWPLRLSGSSCSHPVVWSVASPSVIGPALSSGVTQGCWETPWYSSLHLVGL